MSRVKDPISALTHFIGVLFSIPITFFLIRSANINQNTIDVFSFAIFGIALFLLYLASTIYHTLNISEEVTRILKKIDHMMIFVLIAGTYTPICLIALNNKIGYLMFILVWLIAIGGIFLKAFWIEAPRYFSTAIYIFMGWIVLIVVYPLSKVIAPLGILLLVLGGLSYTLGGVIYAFKWPKINSKLFGFHEVFHIFVLGGSFFHVLFMFMYL